MFGRALGYCGEKFQTPFDGARLPMKWDYPEANPFSDDWWIWSQLESITSDSSLVNRGPDRCREKCCEATVPPSL